MRLAGQMRGGFYPAPEEAVAHAATFLRPPHGEPFAILDPCAGERVAIRQLGALLGCPHQKIFVVELDEGRAEVLQQTIPEANLLAPGSFFGSRVSPRSFSFIWLNPLCGGPHNGSYVASSIMWRPADFLDAARGLTQPDAT